MEMQNYHQEWSKKAPKINQNGVSFAEEIGSQRVERRQDAPWTKNDLHQAFKSKLEWPHNSKK